MRNLHPQQYLVKYASYWYSVPILHWPFQFYCTQNFPTRLFPRPFTAFCITFLRRIFSEWTSSFSSSALQFGDIGLGVITKNCCTEWNNSRHTSYCGLYFFSYATSITTDHKTKAEAFFATSIPHSDNEHPPIVTQIADDFEQINGLFDDTTNEICYHIQAYTTLNESFTYSQMLHENDCIKFFEAMEVLIRDHEDCCH